MNQFPSKSSLCKGCRYCIVTPFGDKRFFDDYKEFISVCHRFRRDGLAYSLYIEVKFDEKAK